MIPAEEGLGVATNRGAEVVELVEVGDLHGVRVVGVPVGDLAVADQRRRVRLPRVEQHRRACVPDCFEAAVVHRERRREFGHDATREAEHAGEAQVDARRAPDRPSVDGLRLLPGEQPRTADAVAAHVHQ